MDLDIIFEDADILVINKPPGVICHPGKKLTDDTLASGIIHHIHGDSPGPHNPGIVHRLDFDTTGVMVVAKNPTAHVHLSRQFEARSVRKEYLALVRGRVARRFGQIDAPLGYAPERYGLMSAKPNALRPRPALSVYEVRERFRGHTLVSVVPKTGRTHQIRVHFEHIGHPLIGEKHYRGGLSPDPIEELMPRLALHAWRLSIVHPGTHKTVDFAADLPADLRATLDRLRTHEPDAPQPPGQ
jgi:23S rRNA pseudouridine1911/1915/1917 synthase